MAKNQFPMTKTGGGLLPRLISALILVVALWLVIQSPINAATFVKHLVLGIGTAISAIATFFGHLVA
jgi:hypothetical protein